MDWYEFLLFLHVTAAIVWIGGGTIMQFFGILVTRDGGERMAGFGRDIEWIGMRVLTPSSLVAFVSGILLVVEGPWSFGDDWIVIGLTLFGISFLAGVAFFGPESGRVGRLTAEHGFHSPEVQRRMGRLILFSRLDLVLLFLIVFDMTVKPEFGDATPLLFGLGGAAVAAALVIWRSLAARSAPPAARAAE